MARLEARATKVAVVFKKRNFGDRKSSGTSEEQKVLAEKMLEILLQLPEGKWNIRESVVEKLEEVLDLPARRELDAAWETVKKKASKAHSRKFVLDRRKELVWIDDPGAAPQRALDKKISPRNIVRLNELANAERCTVDQMVEKLILACTPPEQA